MEASTIISSAFAAMVSAITAYMRYRVDVKAAERKSESVPEKTVEAAKGEVLSGPLQAAIQQHGELKEQAVLELFTEDPEGYQSALRKTLERIAQRDVGFARLLQSLIEQAGIGGTAMTLVGNTINGQVIGQNTGAITNTFNIGQNESDRVASDE